MGVVVRNQFSIEVTGVCVLNIFSARISLVSFEFWRSALFPEEKLHINSYHARNINYVLHSYCCYIFIIL